MKIILSILMAMFLLMSDAFAECGVKTTKRHKSVAHRFMVMTGYPHGRKGWIVDHIIPLCRGGKDAVSNMQWQTKEDAKAKDKLECRCDIPLSDLKIK